MAIEKRYQINVGKRTDIGDYCATVHSVVNQPIIVIAPTLKQLMTEISKHIRQQNRMKKNFPLKPESRLILSGHAE